MSHRFPQFLPDGRRFLYLAMSGQIVSPDSPVVAGKRRDEARSIYAGSLDSDDRTPILKGALRAMYASGHLLFDRESTLMAQPFDPKSLQFTGEAVPVAEQVASNAASGRAAFTVSEGGVLAYRSGGNFGPSIISSLDRTGKRLGSIAAPADHFHVGLRLSPDGKSLAIYAREGTVDTPGFTSGDIWTVDLERGGIASRLTLTPDQGEYGLVWSPDGGRIAFSLGPAGGRGSDIYAKATSGVADAEALLRSASALPTWPTSWSPDGRYIAYDQVDPETNSDIWLLPLFGDRKPVALLHTSFDESSAAFSPDGRFIAYQSDKSGTTDVYIRPFPAGDREWRISEGGGAYPQWRGDGRELLRCAVDEPFWRMPALPVHVNGAGGPPDHHSQKHRSGIAPHRTTNDGSGQSSDEPAAVVASERASRGVAFNRCRFHRNDVVSPDLLDDACKIGDTPARDEHAVGRDAHVLFEHERSAGLSRGQKILRVARSHVPQDAPRGGR
jgi:dipeptidyl aminopeptidase/acylaminoacyl peptidase